MFLPGAVKYLDVDGLLALGDGAFEPRPAVSGIESGDWGEIVEGLQAGDEIVVSSQFLIDSESSMKASLSRMRRR